ncbi:hypothetical protein HDV62DRAFT_68070 [Trichoderma sp. SZMC 28011]
MHWTGSNTVGELHCRGLVRYSKATAELQQSYSELLQVQRPGQPLISGTGRRRASAPYSVRPQTAVRHIHRRVASTRGSRRLEAVSTNCSRPGASHHQPSFCRHAPQTLVLNHQPLILIDPFRSPRALFCSSIRLPARSPSKSQYSLHRHSAPTFRLRSRSYRVPLLPLSPESNLLSTRLPLIIASVLPAGFHFILFLPYLCLCLCLILIDVGPYSSPSLILTSHQPSSGPTAKDHE